MKDLPRTIRTAAGPTVSPSGADVLAELLEIYEREVALTGVEVAEHLAPGLSAGEIVDRLGEIGLTPPDELVVWWGWHNGFRFTPTDTRFTVLPFLELNSIDVAIIQWHNEEPFGSEAWNWDPDWLRLTMENHGYAISCAGVPGSPPAVRYVDAENPIRRQDTEQQVLSLCTPVTWWIESLRNGWYTWHPAGNQWNWDLRHIPEIRRASGML